MKKILLLSALAIMSAVQALAQSFNVGGIAFKVYDTNNSYVEVTEGSNNAFGHFVIPGYVTNDGVDYKVKRVGEYAFFTAASAFDITFEEGVTEIQQFAISYCPNLTAINLPKSLRTLGQSCFARNEKLPSITFPEGLTTIEKFACMGCTSLKEVTFPSTLTTINKEAFKECPVIEIYSYATKAPWVNPNAFQNYDQIVIHVLPGCADAYTEAETWSQCTIVDDLGDEVVGVKTVSTTASTATKTYDLQGRVLPKDAASSANGIRIQNGKKTMR